MPKAQDTVLEINLKALKHNFEHLKSKVKDHTKFLAVVKAFGYGSDACKVAEYLQELDVDYFAVAYVNGGVALRQAGITKPILVLHPQIANLKTLIKHALEPNLYNAKVLKEFINLASIEKQDNYPVHIKFNTGLNRLGFNKEAINDIVAELKKTSVVKVASVFSHLVASEDLNERAFSLNQISSFDTIFKVFTNELGYQPIQHMCNTSGILNYPEAHFDMVRSGIGLYGFGNSPDENKHLIPVASLKTIISQIHNIKKGESVGYNRAFKAESSIKTATLPLGHADGIGRQYGHGKGFVTIHGQKAPIVGNVCMDMIMVDISNIDCKEGDDVIVFGEDTTAEQLAKTTNTISYELITSVSQRVKRVFLK